MLQRNGDGTFTITAGVMRAIAVGFTILMAVVSASLFLGSTKSQVQANTVKIEKMQRDISELQKTVVENQLKLIQMISDLRSDIAELKAAQKGAR